MPKVGYSTMTVGKSEGEKFNILTSNFRHVDGSEKKLKLSEIIPFQEWDDSQWCCVGFQPEGDTLKMFNAEGRETNDLTYVSRAALTQIYYKDESVKPGWYAVSKVSMWDFEEPMGDCYVNFGEGYVVKAGAGAGVVPTLTYSGEVKQAPTEIPGANFSLVGNCTPVDMKVGDIKTNQAWDDIQWGCVGFQPEADTISIFNESGNEEYALTYVTRDALTNIYYKDDSVKPGWYPALDVSQWDFSDCKDNLPLPAGTAFVMKCGLGAGVLPTITIPDPMTVNK